MEYTVEQLVNILSHSVRSQDDKNKIIKKMKDGELSQVELDDLYKNLNEEAKFIKRKLPKYENKIKGMISFIAYLKLNHKESNGR